LIVDFAYLLDDGFSKQSKKEAITPRNPRSSNQSNVEIQYLFHHFGFFFDPFWDFEALDIFYILSDR